MWTARRARLLAISRGSFERVEQSLRKTPIISPMSNPSRTVLHALALVACCIPLLGVAQVATKPLGKPDIEYRQPFTTISGLRELRDGRVIVADSRDKTLQLIDLARGLATPVGRAGAGPGEWGNPTRLYALPSDSTLMTDFSNNRYFIINPDGKPGLTLGVPENGPESSSSLTGIDAMGRMLLVADRRPKGPMDGSVGVADVLRVDRRGRRVDTVATLMQPAGERTAATMMGSGMMRMATNLPLAARDLTAIAGDGRIAIVRTSPYRVEWIGTDGKHVQGPVTVASNIRITDAEREAFTRTQIRPGAILVRGPGGGATPPASSKAGGGGAAKISSAEIKAMMNPDMTWPTVKPPFLDGAVQIDPNGRVWVLRTRAHDDSIPTFDVFDATGRVTERVTLPKRTKLVGFGRGVVYLARTDEDDLVWLQRVRR